MYAVHNINRNQEQADKLNFARNQVYNLTEVLITAANLSDSSLAYNIDSAGQYISLSINYTNEKLLLYKDGSFYRIKGNDSIHVDIPELKDKIFSDSSAAIKFATK
ncbi:MAG: hypothetical protein A2441_02115 [Candidatus Veblenbacteria bacterium RIFOXYC2_FULL_42_11]|uniref:Uncharacterized protein n=2 Tax=Candidatus Vebleniibacteriota TaxID=1817921 RepID=A0A1G2Q5J4_9BACT|nr:MAG: hypothetical protein A2226_04015 [Candidatus Veblenbacteria bacterium RIFOXYA2_FULL_43_9]OHA57142.1 MAG: hypothetical protein A2441_02115 [Candidatus Veblenbacteria bacterium RIFOXYC2_FULL_42_11]